MERISSELRAKGITVLEEPKGRSMFQFFLVQSAKLAPLTWEGLVAWLPITVMHGSATLPCPPGLWGVHQGQGTLYYSGHE